MGVYTHDGFIGVILYPETLLNSFISFSSFLTDSLKLYIIMLSVNDIVLLIFLYCMPFISFYYLIALARTSMLNKLSFQLSKQKYGYYYCKTAAYYGKVLMWGIYRVLARFISRNFAELVRSLITLTKWKISPIM